MKQIQIAIVFVLTASVICAAEGKWTPQQVLQLDPAWLTSQGLVLPPEKLWNPQRGTGLLAAAIDIGGCSSGFVSGTGLLLTNHHCLFSILQQHSTPDNDIITNGFLAGEPSEELPGQSVRATIPRHFTDVTAEILASVPEKSTDLERYRAIEKTKSDLVARCEQQAAARCKVGTFDGGLQYVLIEGLEYPDVRLVYAPPRSVGEFGGEVDNWMWPRHTGDFSIARVYASADGKPAAYSPTNVPLHPEFYFPIAHGDISPGDFAMVLGYPGITYRSYTDVEMAQKRNLYFPRREEVYGEWIRILEETTKGDAAGTIAVADTLKSLLNRFKNAQGQIAGFDRGQIVAKQHAADQEVLTWIAGHPQFAAATQAYRELEKVERDEETTWERDFLLRQLPTGNSLDGAFAGPKLLSAATIITRGAQSREKKNEDRPPAFRDRNLPRLRDRLIREEKSYFAPADEAIMVSWIRRLLARPAAEQPAAMTRSFAGLDGEALARKVHNMVETSRLDEPEQRRAMFDETPARLHARRDPLLELGFALAGDLEGLEDSADRREGAISRLRPEWRRAVIAHAGKPVAPDANGTLRVSFAKIEGYAPRDAVVYEPQTTLSGMIAKHTGQEPFDAPESVRAAAASKPSGRFVDPQLGDIPVDFLATADTTGGNSGSPVLNGKGELIGVNFDRVWENVANDFGYNPDIARNVSVDVRYLLWMLDKVSHAGALLKELGVQ